VLCFSRVEARERSPSLTAKGWLPRLVHLTPVHVHFSFICSLQGPQPGGPLHFLLYLGLPSSCTQCCHSVVRQLLVFHCCCFTGTTAWWPNAFIIRFWRAVSKYFGPLTCWCRHCSLRVFCHRDHSLVAQVFHWINTTFPHPQHRLENRAVPGG
jgi:hypothetical protein